MSALQAAREEVAARTKAAIGLAKDGDAPYAVEVEDAEALVRGILSGYVPLELTDEAVVWTATRGGDILGIGMSMSDPRQMVNAFGVVIAQTLAVGISMGRKEAAE